MTWQTLLMVKLSTYQLVVGMYLTEVGSVEVIDGLVYRIPTYLRLSCSMFLCGLSLGKMT